MGGNFSQELKRVLTEAGCRFERQGKGDHQISYSPLTGFVSPSIAKSSRVTCNDPLIAAISGRLIDLFGGSVVVMGAALQAPANNFAVLVDNGCSGLEATILVIAATLAFPTSWKFRLIGAAICSLAILGVNLLRVISLFYIGQYSREWFDWAHLYAWDVLIMIDGLVAYALWIRFVRAREGRSDARV